MHIVKLFLLEGKTTNQIIELTGLSKSTISFHRKCLGREHKSPTKYNWNEVNIFLIDHSVKDTIEKFGMTKATIWKARKTGKISYVTTPSMSLKEYLKYIDGKTTNNRPAIFRKFKKDNVYECMICKINEWNEKEIRLQVHHVDGNKINNNIENLQFLCPNCHSQTETFSGKNINKIIL